LRRTASAVLVALGLLAPASTAGAGQAASYAFGRLGGNIAPFTVHVATNGAVTSSGPVAPKKSRVSVAARATIATVVSRQRFFSLPARIQCAGTLPDVAANAVTVTSGTRTRTVTMHGSCSPRLRAVYNALAAATGVDKI
jgi:hypothetical protein